MDEIQTPDLPPNTDTVNPGNLSTFPEGEEVTIKWHLLAVEDQPELPVILKELGAQPSCNAGNATPSRVV